MTIRQKVFAKTSGYCYLCGCELNKGWHIDHVDPLAPPVSADGFSGTLPYMSYLEKKERRKVNDNINNMMPACPSCNINKRNKSIEDFRIFIYQMLQNLNKRNVPFIICKRYGLLTENNIEIKFYFEKKQYKSIFLDKKKSCTNSCRKDFRIL